LGKLDLKYLDLSTTLSQQVKKESKTIVHHSCDDYPTNINYCEIGEGDKS